MMYSSNKEDKKSLSMHEFVKLLLADLASKSTIVYFNKEVNNKKILYLNSNYKEKIEYILKNNEYFMDFSNLIDLKYYFNSQSNWEERLGRIIGNVLNELDKKIEYDFCRDAVKLEFDMEEINEIKSLYDDDILELMDQFSTLLKENYYDRNMMLRNKEFDNVVEKEKNITKKKVKIFRKRS